MTEIQIVVALMYSADGPVSVRWLPPPCLGRSRDVLRRPRLGRSSPPKLTIQFMGYTVSDSAGGFKRKKCHWNSRAHNAAANCPGGLDLTAKTAEAAHATAPPEVATGPCIIDPRVRGALRDTHRSFLGKVRDPTAGPQGTESAARNRHGIFFAKRRDPTRFYTTTLTLSREAHCTFFPSRRDPCRKPSGAGDGLSTRR
jgi:hypothetical protein